MKKNREYVEEALRCLTQSKFLALSNGGVTTLIDFRGEPRETVSQEACNEQWSEIRITNGHCAMVIWARGWTLLPNPFFLIRSVYRGWLGADVTYETARWFYDRIPTLALRRDLPAVLQRFGLLTDPPDVVEVAVCVPHGS